MRKDFKSGKVKRLPINNLNLPNFVNNSIGNNTKVNSVEGTNVIRVPFGKRFPKKQRPDKNQNIFLTVDQNEDMETAGGYAKEASDE